MYSVLIIFRIEILNLQFLKCLLYFVRETRTTAPETYIIFHVLRQVSTVQSTNCLKQ
jgi:hypothetical protein